MNLKKYDLSGIEIDSIALNKDTMIKVPNHQQIKDYIVAIQKNKRQWSANTKGRSEIALSNSKPHPQKGSGRARQGCIKVSQYRKGAVVFGPKPKFNMHTKINQKERRATIRYLLAEKANKAEIIFLDEPNQKKPQTKELIPLLEKLSLKDQKILFVFLKSDADKQNYKNFYLSARNIKKAKFLPLNNLSGLDLLNTKYIVAVGSAQEKLKNMIEGTNE